MYYTIKFKSKDTIVDIPIESDMTPDSALFMFLRRYYPCQMGLSETGNTDEHEVILKDRLNGLKTIWKEGDTESSTFIGVLSIDPDSKSSGTTIKPIDFQNLCAEEWNRMNRQSMQQNHPRHASAN